VAGTQGVPGALADGDRESLTGLVPQILANSKSDAVELLDNKGLEVYGWQRPPDQDGGDAEERSGADFSQLEDVRLVLGGHVDEFGEKRTLLGQTPYGLMVFTVGPVYREGELIGAVMVGTYVSELLADLTESAVAKITFYDRNGTVVDTTLGGGQESIAWALRESPEQYERSKKDLIETTLDDLDRYVPDIRQRIVWERDYRPTDWQTDINATLGTAFGSLAQGFFQSSYFRPHNKARDIQGLYFVGQGTYPGIGMPMVMISSRLVTERIVQEWS